jgi:hypothetical protein
MSYILDTVDLYLAPVAFWALAIYFLTPIILGRFNPIPTHLPVSERDPKHWAVFFLRWGMPISVSLSCLFVVTYLLAYQELFPRDYKFINLQWELKNTYVKYGAFLIPAIFIEHHHYFTDLEFPEANGDEKHA